MLLTEKKDLPQKIKILSQRLKVSATEQKKGIGHKKTFCHRKVSVLATESHNTNRKTRKGTEQNTVGLLKKIQVWDHLLQDCDALLLKNII